MLVPPTVSETPSGTDYSQPGGTDTGAVGDALDVILDAEWDEYKNLRASVVPARRRPR